MIQAFIAFIACIVHKMKELKPATTGANIHKADLFYESYSSLVYSRSICGDL
jgi:hypothetical protein